MRAQPGENKWADVDVSYTSAFWEDRTWYYPTPFPSLINLILGIAASEVFIVPTVVSGQGTRQLLSITDQGISELIVQASELAEEAKIVDHEQIAIKFSLLHEHRLKQETQRRGLTELSEQLRALRVLENFKSFAALVEKAHDLAEHLVAKFGQLKKVAQRVLAEQEGKGDELTATPEALKKLTISIKCVDTIWADIISSWTKLKKLRNKMQEAKVALPPIRQRMKVIGTNDEKSGDSNGQGAQGDAQGESNPEGAATVSQGATVEHGLEEGKASSLSDEGERALIEKFVEKCKTSDAE